MKRIHWIILGVVGAAVLVAVVVVLWGSLSDHSTSDDPAKRKEAAAKLDGKSDEDSLRTLHRLSQDDDVGVARAAVRAIRGSGEAKKHERNRQLLQRVVKESKSAKVRGDAAAALGDFDNVPAGMLINVLENDPEPAARAGAARGLGFRGDPDALIQLFNALRDKDPVVRAEAITALSRITAFRFDYDARVSPAKQGPKLTKIRATLRDRCGM